MMNNHVKARMFTVPVIITPLLESDSMGDMEPGLPINLMGYVQEEYISLPNSLGVVELSTMQIYLAEEDMLNVPDNSLVTCLSNVDSKIIKKQSYYFPQGKPGLGVVYLP